MASATNTINSNTLEYVKELGEGGFSSVYQMTWTRPEGPIEIAAKKLRKRDVHELEVLSSLDHPHIVKLLGVVDEKMEFMLILELCERGSLRFYLDGLDGNGLSDQRFYDWAEEGARPLEYLRQKGLVHKDIKSPNYMITGEFVLKLGDFGLAKKVDASVGNATERGSHRWMAPELLGKGVLSPKYDIFAFAVVLWEMRTGKVPFPGLDWQVIAWKVINEKERLPIPDNCPEPIKNLMKQCWEEDWHKRPTIQEVINVIVTAVTAYKEEQQRKLIAGPWKLESIIGSQYGLPGMPGKLYWARGVVVNPINMDIAVCDQGAQQVKVYANNGEYKFSMETTHGLDPEEKSQPWQVAVNLQGTTYFVTDWSKRVKCYDVSGKFKCHWVSRCLQASCYPGACYPCLRGLAVDPDGSVHVGDIENNCINTHKEDRCYISSIKVGIGPKNIAITSQDTIVVAESYRAPQIVNKSGQSLHTLKHPVNESQWNTRGVCCYRDVILIVNAHSKSDTILCYTDRGLYLGDMSAHIQGIYAWGIAVAPDGRKILVSADGKIYIYSLL